MTDFHPSIYLFNPTCEYAVANGSANWQPKRILQKMEFDLSALPLYFAKNDDFILVDRIPSEEFIVSLKQIDIPIPNFILKTDAANNPDFIDFSIANTLTGISQKSLFFEISELFKRHPCNNRRP